MATDTLNTDIDEIMPGVIADRRYLHTIPELGLQEFKTSAYVLERFDRCRSRAFAPALR